MKHKFLSLFIAIVAMTILYSPSFASVTINGIAYILNEKTATVVDGVNYTGTIVIPSSVTYNSVTYSVTSIGVLAFRNCTGLTSVTIPNSVTSIGNEAFYKCTGLTSINVASNNPNYCSIDGVLFNKNKITLICYPGGKQGAYTIPNSVTSIGRYAFRDCTGLTSVTIPNSVTSIGNSAFEDCTGLTSVTIPNSVTSIGNGAFSGCTSLTSVTIPNSVTSIVYAAFHNCSGLTSVTIPNSVTSIGQYAFAGCTGLTSVTIPNSVTSIGNEAFYKCTGLTSVTIPSSVTSIGYTAFKNCTGLTSINVASDNPNYCSAEGVLFNKDKTKLIRYPVGNTRSEYIIPNSVTSIGKYAFDGCSSLTSVTIPNSVTSIGDYAFYGCTGLTSVTIPNSVTRIGYSVFEGCSGLTSVTIGNSVTSIGQYAFQYCTGLTSVTIPNSVKSIGYWAFRYCSSLTSVTIGNSVTSIGDEAFAGCDGLTSVIWNAKNCNNFDSKETPFFADYYKLDLRPQIKTFVFGDSVEHIPSYLCVGMTNLNDLTIGSSITAISTGDFSGCNNIKNVTINSNAVVSKNYGSSTNLSAIFGTQVREYIIGEGVSSIGNYAFYNSSSLQSITLPNSLLSIGNSAFLNCANLKTVNLNSNAIVSKTYTATNNFSTIFGSQVQTYNIGDAITAIGDYAFYNCGNSTSLNIPDGVTTIGNNSFAGCSGVTSLVIPESVTSIESNTFHGCTALSSVNLPNTITSIKDSAFFNCSSLQLESLPSSVTTLGKATFSGCGSLASIAIPASLTSVGENAFYDCSGIAEVKIENVDSWCKIDFGNSKSNPVFYSRNLYIGDSLIAELTIPNKITELKPWAFVNCNSINAVLVPNTVRLFSPNAFYDCENIASVEWHAKNIADYASSSASPFYASRSKITSFVFGEETEHIPSHLCNGMSKINLLSFPSDLKSIGDYSFKDLTKIRKINIPNEVTSIGAHAFDSCILVTSIYLGYQVEEIGDYAFKGCIRVNDITSMNTTTPVVYENTLSSISDYAYLYVPAGSKRTYQLDPYWGRFDIREIASEDATLSKDAVIVEANEDNAIFTWPTENNAASYSLQITKDGVVFCTLVFNSNGQLTGIAFAPGRNGTSHAPAATTSVAGMSFTVTGLSSASKYAFSLSVADDNNQEIVNYQGEFATTGYEGEVVPGGEPVIPGGGTTAIDDVNSATPSVGTTKFFRNGHLYILRDGKTYTVQGQEVR